MRSSAALQGVVAPPCITFTGGRYAAALAAFYGPSLESMALFEAGNGGGADVGRDSEASSPVSASFGVLTFCCIYRGGRRIEHKLNNRKEAQEAQKFLWLCAFCAFLRLFPWPLV